MSIDVPTTHEVDRVLSEGDVSVSGDMLMASESPLLPAAVDLAHMKSNGTQEEMKRLCLAHLATYRLLPLVTPSSPSTSANEETVDDHEWVINALSMVDKVEELKEEKSIEEEVMEEMETKLVIDEHGRESITMVPKQQPNQLLMDQQKEEQKEKQKEESPEQKTPKDEVKYKVKEAEKINVKGVFEEVAVTELLSIDEASVKGTTTPTTVVVDDSIGVDGPSLATTNDGTEAVGDVDTSVIANSNEGGAVAGDDVSGGAVVDSDSDVDASNKGDEEDWVDEWAGFEDHEEAVEDIPVDTLLPPSKDTLSEETLSEEEAVVAGTSLDQPKESDVTPTPHDKSHTHEDTLEPESNPDGEHDTKLEAKEDGLVDLNEGVMTPAAVEATHVEGKEVVEEESEKEKEKGDIKDEKVEEIEDKVAFETDTAVSSEDHNNNDAEEGEVSSVHLDDHDKHHDKNHRDDDDDRDSEHVIVDKPDIEEEEGLVLDPSQVLKDTNSAPDVVEDNQEHHHDHIHKDDSEEEEEEEDNSVTSIIAKDSKSETKDSDDTVEDSQDYSQEGITVLVPIATVPSYPLSDVFDGDISSIGYRFMVHVFRHHGEKAHRTPLEFHFLMVAVATVFLYALAALAITCSLLARM